MVYVGDKFPYAKQVVYTFHMSAFLVISGYLANMDKSVGRFAGQVKWLFVPYAVMESGYVVMASFLPIREHIDSLTPALFFDKLLLHPLGPYWYLHTLIVCYLIYYAVSRLGKRLDPVSQVCLFGVCLFVVSRFLRIMSFDNAIYFLAGVTAMGGIRIIPEPVGWMYVAGISIICTMVSNFFLVNAVKNAGPTLASVFGALEPLTAVLTGVLFLGERLSVLNIAGIIMILTTVTIVVIYQNKQKA